jgi:hypothetical protein
MNTINEIRKTHPTGERGAPGETSLAVETFGGRIHVEWDAQAAVTPLGQLPFFIEFLKSAELFEPWVEECPLVYCSPNAPAQRDVLGTILLSVLAGHTRYAHIAAMRCDGVNPRLLGMKKVLSEDSVRRAFQHAPEPACGQWQQRHLLRGVEPLLYEPWVLDVDTTVKPLYGHQEGAVLGYNPIKRGRPSHVYHTYFMAQTRLVLGVEVQPGNQTAAHYTSPGLFALLDSLAPAARPTLLRGDIAFGEQPVMQQAEARGQPYLFKLRLKKRNRQCAESLFRAAPACDAGQGWEAVEGRWRLTGWTRERRVIALRRPRPDAVSSAGSEVSAQCVLPLGPMSQSAPPYEYAVLVTSLAEPILSVAQLYRDRGDAENPYDELKNQWGWSGFTTRDMQRCQIMARHIALIYNWWSLFVRLAIPERHAEAVTTRPLLLQAVAKQTTHAGQTRLTITSMHGEARVLRKLLASVNQFLGWLRRSAEQLDWNARWRVLLSRVFIWPLRGRLLASPKMIGDAT